ncbi:L-histidine N(alpha)-methyltransferase [Zeaxanthinibacter enoshimensis]|uniref:Dimethylhistidine N-methyltransferase n=1 Tax=Zeaxanthinibacter enoshimensis TaxID=392009 RepID=A0A4R6TIM5_9FLAO|nr:L-histidine N(alpha)-methyltransferase [Zeaxanthinibacter enoshimensis]TDQ30616.1 dimethylhistidine N-methyltransferase [Zeaxanthinibacter enoshimensis]
MQPHTLSTLKSPFERDVYRGLTDYPKHLSSKYFYDKAGDQLFQDIMEMPEYYLTRCEFRLLETNRADICRQFAKGRQPFNLIELGAGDGKKTKILLKELLEQQADFKYLPIDISGNVLEQLQRSVEKEIPGVAIHPMEGTYFEILEKLQDVKERKVILFLGSNIGNLLHKKAIEFLKGIRQLMGPEDLLFIGFDQKKDPQTILDAYNDPAGITEAFNKNILVRMNRELDANFEPDNFKHWETYDPETGTARSYLVSTKKQSVYLGKLDLQITLEAWESIHTEISQKYDHRTVQWLADEAGLGIGQVFEDLDGCYKNYIFTGK